MKKVYTKPLVVVEDFSLCTTIASCSIKTKTPSEYNCAYEVKTGFGSFNVFTSALPDVCTVSEATDGSDDGVYNGICYHAPMSDSSLFNS